MTTPLSVEQAAAAANLSEKTIRRALKAGTLDGSKVGAVWRIFPEDLEAWLISQRPSVPTQHTTRRTTAHRRQRGSLRALEEATGGGST